MADLLSIIEIPGPWQHRYVAANGARFHVAETGSGPLVVLLHGFPEFWWCWRHTLPVLADAGFRAAAMDLRGYGGSDKPPRGYDPMTLAGDVAGVVKALGERSAVIVGQGWGGYVGWTAAALHPREVTGLAAVAAPHPLQMLRDFRPGRPALGALRHAVAMQLPILPEHRLGDPSRRFVDSHLRSWSAPDAKFPTADDVARYEAAMSIWPAPHCALEYHRWLARSRLRSDGRRFNALLQKPIAQPVLSILGAADLMLPAAEADRSGGRVAGSYTSHVMPDVGHFPVGENPEALNEILVEWLRAVKA